MDFSEAKQQLLLHGSGTTDADGRPQILEDGFLGSLRPYRGLQEKNFHRVMEALLTVGERVYQAQQVDREIAHTVWSTCRYARVWGLHPNGMLQRNRLITADDTTRLELWTDTVDRAYALKFHQFIKAEDGFKIIGIE